MIYYTGDTHGDVEKLFNFKTRFGLTAEDTIVILGDAGWNYDQGEHDRLAKMFLKRMGVTIFAIHGNHEERPYNLPHYHEIEWHGGIAYVEDDYPNILFGKDGEIYDLDGHLAIVIGGAYSVDKPYRLAYGYHWFPSELPDDATSGTIQLLIPLCLATQDKADLAIVVEDYGTMYRASTCLTLDQAINNARLLARPDRDWLNP